MFGYKTKAEKYQSQAELLLNEQKILKEQIKVYKQISEESIKMKNLQKEQDDQLKLEINIFKEIVKRTKKYVQRHFSLDTQTEILKLLDRA